MARASIRGVVEKSLSVCYAWKFFRELLSAEMEFREGEQDGADDETAMETA